MGDRRKSWHRALMEGLQATTALLALLLIIFFIIHLTSNTGVYDYFYLIVPLFVICFLSTYRYSAKQLKHMIYFFSKRLNK